jgi:hypothetical protein
VVRLAGFEPTTPWFVAKYSIQLSYSREASQYTQLAMALTCRGVERSGQSRSRLQPLARLLGVVLLSCQPCELDECIPPALD